MDELIAKVAERAGISAEQAQQAVEAVLEQLKDRLPEPLGSEVSGLLDGSTNPTDLLGGLGDKLGGLLGR